MSNNNGLKPPAPKLDKKPEEEESSSMDIVVQGDRIVIQFARPVNWIALTPDQAVGMGQALSHCAKLARSKNKKLIMVPGHPD